MDFFYILYKEEKNFNLWFLVEKTLNIVPKMEINGLNITILLQIKKMQKTLAITVFM